MPERDIDARDGQQSRAVPLLDLLSVIAPLAPAA